MTVDKKIKDIDTLSKKEIRNGANYFDVDKEICVIDGEEYPMFYAKIINKQIENEMPFVLFLGKPGSGKTFASAKLGYDLTEKIGFYDGEYTPEQNIKYENIEFMQKLLDSKNKVLHKPDINATLNVVEHHKDQNRAFESFIHLARIFGNLVTGDSQYLFRCDTGIQITHTFRIIASSKASEYKYHVYYIERKVDSEKKEVNKTYLGSWTPELPPKKLQKYIKERDKEEKKNILEEKLNQAKGKDEEKEKEDHPMDGIEMA